MKTRLVLAAIIAVTALAYIPGLSGQFIFDDLGNFENLDDWAAGNIGWQQTIMDHPAGPLGRPLAMATFLANTAVSGVDPFAFKLTNLILHLVIGVLLFAIMRRLTTREPNLAPRAELAALAITAIWLLHPLMVGTVLYAVQRMAMLAALFMLLAVLSYLHGRSLLESGHIRRGAAWIFTAVPIFTLFGALSKENALLAPLVCAAIELTFFREKHCNTKRPAAAKFFLVLCGLVFLLIPATLWVVKPDFYLESFQNRPFTLVERLLTQGRVLFDYVGQLLLPRGSQMSLFRDDYTVSTDLLTPWTTLVAWVGWVSVMSGAWLAKNAVPGVIAGLAIFLIGHAMESSIFPLLIYFEHRNYFPAIGLFLAVASIVCWLYDRLRHRIKQPARAGIAAMVSIILVLSATTFVRAMTWSSNETLLWQSLDNYPDSRTSRIAIAELEMNRNPPNVASALVHYSYLTQLDRPSTRIIGHLGRIAASCFSHQRAPSQSIESIESEPPESIEADFIEAVDAATRIVITENCDAIQPAKLGDAVLKIIEKAPLKPGSKWHWRLNYRAAQLFAKAGEYQKASDAARAAWAPGQAQLPVAALLTDLLIQTEKLDSADDLLQKLEAGDIDLSPDAQQHIDALREQLSRAQQQQGQ